MKCNASLIELRTQPPFPPLIRLQTSQTFKINAGQYLMAWNIAERDAALATPLFPGGMDGLNWIASKPLSAAWMPGAEIQLRGPLGKGFALPPAARKVALGMSAPYGALFPLIGQALNQNAAVALFADTPPGQIPTDVEVQPLQALQDALPWADYLALESHPDFPIQQFISQKNLSWPAAAEILLHFPMPCGGEGECGICAVTLRRGSRLACQHGPVFSLSEYSHSP